ncbi:SdpI family protein [Corynebacterium marquesiae]|uniref:SdpI family protein n=1 Tax=Corynebacterium marquesiae TaxID=2913503 RepID=UPI00254D5B6B|nr:SdpI family protein [Corynebacterium marquesiae]MDK8496076.1 SdpI family protein [Corynebacterium marquesiae]
MIAVGIIFLILAVFLIVVGALASSKRLPGNSYIGLRLQEIRKSREAWDNAHRVAGPFWILSGVCLVFGGIVALRAQGWMWLIPVLTFVAAVLALSIGSNLGSRAAFLYEQAHADEEGCGESCNCGSDGCGGEEAPAASAPQVDVDALRHAARESDR